MSSKALFRVSSLAAVSPRAASIKFINCLPPNYVVASSMDGRVDWSSRSDGTLAAKVPYDTNLAVTDPYPFPCERWRQAYNGTTFHLWHFTIAEDVPIEEGRRLWRVILDDIVTDIVQGQIDRQKFKASINGVTSNANRMVRIDRRPATVVSAILQRLHARAAVEQRYKEFVEHPKFRKFCDARALDYLSGDT
jgi:hypothetical protein